MKNLNLKLENNKKGITLISLVITIVVLLILAGVIIAVLMGNNGILTRAKDAKSENLLTSTIEKIELAIIGSYNLDGNIDLEKLNTNLKNIDEIDDSNLNIKSLPAIVKVDEKNFVIKRTGKVFLEPITTTELPTTVVKNDTNYMDNYGNIVTIPAGFKIAQDSGKNVNEGIVIEDVENGGKGNQFTWIPVGDVYTDIERTENNKKIIKLNRYAFSNNNIAIERNENIIDGYCQELTYPQYGNAISYNIDDFKNSVSYYGGYYIGRYECGIDNFDSLEETNSNNEIKWTGYNGGKVVVQRNKQVYNYITQLKASEISQSLYVGKEFTSDLINSYAWDTALYFIQVCEDNSYPNKNSTQSNTVYNTGMLENENEYDVRCNIFDMAGNVLEWSTESSNYPNFPCISRGGETSYNYYYSKTRQISRLSDGNIRYGFRVILYL